MNDRKKTERTHIKLVTNDDQKLAAICLDICSNYEKLMEEFKQIEEILSTAEICGVAYLKRNMVAMHLRSYLKADITFETLKSILDKLNLVSENAGTEFVQNVDFLNICNAILDENTKENVVPFVWDAKKVMHYLLYQLGRIKTAEKIEKKVSILKGMIAYY